MAQRPITSSPIPPYSNPPIEPQFYQPSEFAISALSFGVTTIVTTVVNHNYVIGQLIRILIPSKYGSRALNEQLGNVITIPAPNQVEVAINSIGTDPFIASPTFVPFQSRTLPQIVAVGDYNSGYINPTGRVTATTAIPGSFINISPL